MTQKKHHRRLHYLTTTFPIRFVVLTAMTENGRNMSQTEQKSEVFLHVQ